MGCEVLLPVKLEKNDENVCPSDWVVDGVDAFVFALVPKVVGGKNDITKGEGREKGGRKNKTAMSTVVFLGD